jgi:signal transduction histidine kinase
MTAIPFAGLAPDSRRIRGGGEIATFDLRRAIEIGRTWRALGEAGPPLAQAAAALVDAVNALEHDNRPACALVRAFAVRRSSAVLVATGGLEAAWNDLEQSARDRTPSVAAESAPVLADLADQLVVGGAGLSVVARVYADGAGFAGLSPGFVRSYGIRAVVAFAAKLSPAESMVVVAYVRAPLDESVLPAFRILAHHARLLWLHSSEMRAALPPREHERACSDARDDVVAAYEEELEDLLREWTRRLTAARTEAQRAAEANASLIDEQNRHLRRTQRAMLNVVEDLREARSALALKVAERTQELASANSALEARNRELEEFVYIASHDLQEPLRTIAGYLQMIERRYGAVLGPQGDEFIRFAIQGSQRMQALIESLLVYSRAATRTHSFEWLSLDEAVELAVQNLAVHIEESGAVIQRGPLPRVRGDRVQLVQVFQNLLSNAIKFAGPRPPRIQIAGDVTAAGCTVRVRDEGIGFNPKYADRIFKIFRRLRRDTPGTGIGLAVCKKIVERHGGRIEAVSEPGKGATFSVHLPSAAQDMTHD